TAYAVTSGRATSRTPTRTSVVWPSSTAQTTALVPAARKACPRRVSPESASRTTHSCSPGAAGRDRDGREDRVEDRGRSAPGHRRLDGRQQPVREDGGGERRDVVGQHVVATVKRGARLRGTHQVERRTRRGAQAQLVVRSR